MKRVVFLSAVILTVILLVVPVACGGGGEPSLPPSSPETPEQPPPSEPETSSAAQELSAQIAAVDVDETTALTSLFRISDEISQAQSDGSLYEGEEAELQADLMWQFSDWVDTREDRLGLASLPPAPTGNITWSSQDRNLLSGADERIEQYRKGDATISVVDASGAPVANAVVSLDMLQHDFLFGCWVNGLPSDLAQTAYLDSIAKLFNYATLTFFWQWYEAVQGREDEARMMGQALWASQNGLTIKGHPLVYPAFGIPDWANQLSPEELDEALQERVTSLVTDFSGFIDYWDALNEPTKVDGYLEPLRSWALSQTQAGAEVLTLEWARAANPEVKLVVNDFTEGYNRAFYNVLEDVIAAGGKFDAIGIESYMCSGLWTMNEAWDLCERYNDFNIPLHFTEIAVLSGEFRTDVDWSGNNPGWETTPEGEAIQAEYVPAFYTILFSHPSVQATTWTWLYDGEVAQGAPWGLLREDMSPKPAYEQLMRLIQKEWWTNAEATTDAQGEAVIRGFYGQYLVTVESGTQKIQRLIHIEAGQEDTFEVQIH
jgi:GH35 family endo-1,4-beta-xylanase